MTERWSNLVAALLHRPATDYETSVQRLREQWTPGEGQLRLHKRTISNLFRYQPRASDRPVRRVSLDDFNVVIGLDPQARTMDVGGLTTFESVVRHSLPRGFLPLVTPELKHITVGGAIVGIGVESTGFRHGFVHDGLLEADVLLPSGEIVTANADNEHADLFHALPNSYGTLGYVLRARIRLQPAPGYVHLRNESFGTAGEFLQAMKAATERDDIDFVEGLFHGDGRFRLSTGRMVGGPVATDDIIRKHLYYRLVDEQADVHLSTFDYIFRFDADWFWNVPEGGVYDWFRRYAPARMRTSGFYTRFAALKTAYMERTGRGDPQVEPLIQDWQVRWDDAEELVRFCLEHVDLGGRPWAVIPIRSPGQATLYPVKPGELYLNLGSYCQVRRPEGMEPFTWTRIVDRKCLELGGIKMLYSSTFLTRAEFDETYNGADYRRLKAKYDPQAQAMDLFEKTVYQAQGAQ